MRKRQREAPPRGLYFTRSPDQLMIRYFRQTRDRHKKRQTHVEELTSDPILYAKGMSGYMSCAEGANTVCVTASGLFASARPRSTTTRQNSRQRCIKLYFIQTVWT